SRMCMLTGRNARECGAWDNNTILDPALPTLPKVLAAAGYTTCLVGKMHFGGNLQFHGFQHRPYGDLTGRTGHQWEPQTLLQDSTESRTMDAGITAIPESKLQDEVVATETIAFLREQRHATPEKPWFLCASFSRPHFPLTSPRRHFERYWPHGVTAPRVPAGGDAYNHPMSVGMRQGFKVDRIGHEEMMRARAAYFGCVSYLDEVIGDLLLRLEADGLLENTIIVYTSDHGEMAGEHGTWWKNGWYEACTRVPLIISTPEQRRQQQAAGTVTTPVSHAALFPTLCSMAGVAWPATLPGPDLAAAVRGEASVDTLPVFCDNLNPRWGEGTEFRMIRWGQYKYVRFRNCEPLFFDLANDPGEQENLVNRATGAAQEALDYLATLATESIDFAAAAQEREESSTRLQAQYAFPGETGLGNHYLMPSGQVVEADDTLYRPTVRVADPAQVYADWPGV
ncbi:MAG: sulfatase-like hydrolase/transferase, partial [Caldilineaceae bacterium]|nr:sulfatase-like hydrolase/transferase [Caldilineaceae bacterium]